LECGVERGVGRVMECGEGWGIAWTKTRVKRKQKAQIVRHVRVGDDRGTAPTVNPNRYVRDPVIAARTLFRRCRSVYPDSALVAAPPEALLVSC